MVMVAAVVVIVTAVPFAGGTSNSVSTDGTYEILPEVKIRVVGLVHLRFLLPLSVHDILNGLESLIVDNGLMLATDLASRVKVECGDLDDTDVELVP